MCCQALPESLTVGVLTFSRDWILDQRCQMYCVLGDADIEMAERGVVSFFVCWYSCCYKGCQFLRWNSIHAGFLFITSTTWAHSVSYSGGHNVTITAFNLKIAFLLGNKNLYIFPRGVLSNNHKSLVTSVVRVFINSSNCYSEPFNLCAAFSNEQSAHYKMCNYVYCNFLFLPLD